MSESYRQRALSLLPHVCARCGRVFSGRRLRELTVHHKDGDHHHNPPDGSNWELLCIYCHENEHARFEDGRAGGSREARVDPARHRALAGLEELLRKKKKT